MYEVNVLIKSDGMDFTSQISVYLEKMLKSL